MTDNTERLHTLNGNNIPAEAKGYPEKNRIGMDTGHRRNFLQLWIGRRRPTTEEGIIKMLYQTVQSDLKELRVKQKKQKNPTPNVKYTKSQFTKAMTKYHMNGGYSFGEFTLEMSWLDFQKNTKTFDWLMPYF